MNVTFSVHKTVQADVVVCGGGIAGCAAALAAARHGADVVLIEDSGVLGGAAALGLVTPMDSVCSRSGKPFGGIPNEFRNGIESLCREYGSDPKSGDRCSFAAAPHMTKILLVKLLTEAGVRLHFHTRLCGADVSGAVIARVFAVTKSGMAAYEAPQFVDATGDGDLLVLTGAPVVLGSEPGVFDELTATGMAKVHYEAGETEKYSAYEENGLMQPVSLFFVMGGVDYPRAQALNNKQLTYADLGITREEFARLPCAGTCGFEENGDLLPLPQGRVLVTRGTREDVAVVNMSRVIRVNGADADSLNDGEIKARLQLLGLLDVLKRFIPGFENSYLIDSASTLGVRESRRLRGQYVLRGSDVIGCVPFPDVIAHGSYIIDIHDPTGKRKAVGGAIRGDCYDIPYRSLRCEEIANLHAAGRCISVDHVAHSSTRIQGTCAATGQAAGTAAAMLAREPLAFSVDTLQKSLRADGVRL